MILRTAALASLFFFPSLICAQNLSALDAYPSDRHGNPIPPVIGEAFFVTTRFESDKIGVAPRLSIETPYGALETTPVVQAVDRDGEHKVVWGPIPSLMDRAVPLRVSLDSRGDVLETDETDNQLMIEVVPTSSARSIEAYSPQELEASMAFMASFVGRPTRVVAWIPVPTTHGFQTLLWERRPVGATTVQSTPFSQPISVLEFKSGLEGWISGSADYRVSASSVRTNAALLRAATFSDYARHSRAYAQWLAPEQYIESRHREIAAVVKSALPKDYKRSMRPYDAAERLYLEVLRRCRYTTSTNGKPSAVGTLRRGEGDCGYLSSLFVALCRNAGIPARTVNGFTMGLDRWHVWAEFAVPGHGWVPVDPAYAKGVGADGSLPLYFGVIPELNQRFATGYGFDRAAQRLRLPMLQSPAIFWYGTGAKLAQFDVSCSLTKVSAP